MIDIEKVKKELKTIKENHIQLKKEKYHSLEESGRLSNLLERLEKRYTVIENAIDSLDDYKHNYETIKLFQERGNAYQMQVLTEYNELKRKSVITKPHVYTLFITDGPRNHMWNREISENRCGSCDKKIDRDFAFCPNCGQALDWSEVK